MALCGVKFVRHPNFLVNRGTTGGTMSEARSVKRVGIVFSGGPAPAANAVISAAAISFLESGREVLGFFHGYSNLEEYHPTRRRLLPGRDYRVLTNDDVRGIRNSRGILIGTARANPGRGVMCPEDLKDTEKTQRLRNVYNALVDLDVDALISIGGDGTLMTANYLYEWQKRLPPDVRRLRIVHLPKTIDNDYHGIDFTFGFFTAVDVMAREVQNLRADARATSSWFVAETMGRKAGWVSYGVAIAGEAHLVLASEDLVEGLADENGKLDLEALSNHIVDIMLARERNGKHYGVVVLAEGLAEALPVDALTGVSRDSYGQVKYSQIDLARLVSEHTAARYQERTGRKKSIKSKELGYESRCAPPHAFDVMLGSQLGIGSYRARVEEGLDGHMVSVSGQLDLNYVPFEELVEPDNMSTAVRYIRRGSDFHRLARFLESRVDAVADWTPGARREV